MTSNLKSRNLHGTEEHFFYDTDGKQLNRLAGTGPDENTVSETYAFADNGNITEKQGVGDYVYHPEKKNAVTQIDIPELGQNQDLVQFVSYNHFNSASEIKNLDDQLRVNLEYGPDDQRRVAKYWDESGAQDELIKTRLYAGAYEKQTNADLTEIEVHYISAGGQLAAIYVVENGVGSYYYPHQDHLGSIIHITDANGDVVYTQSFDPWGRTRNPIDLTYENIPERPDWLWRGYTGHEHLDEFGLINMNGRLYDPVVGRMLSPDNYVQSPDFSQSYNRYSYVWNNPLKYTDPTGEFIFAATGLVYALANAVIAGAAMGAASYTLSVATSQGGFSNFNAGDLLKSTAMGAAAGAVSFGVGTAVGAVASAMGSAATTTAGQLALGATQALAHGATQTGLSAAFGQEVNWGTFATSAISSAVGSATGNLDPGLRVMASGAAGGATSALTGGSFMDGAFQGMMIATTNHLMHGVTKKANLKYITKNGTEFENRQELIHAMLEDQSKEYAGADFIDKTGAERYFMLDASSNSRKHALFKGEMLPEYVKISRSYHTHPSGNPPGRIDAQNAYIKGHPSYVVTNRFSYLTKPIPMAPLHSKYYLRTFLTSDWLQGNFQGLE